MCLVLAKPWVVSKGQVRPPLPHRAPVLCSWCPHLPWLLHDPWWHDSMGGEEPIRDLNWGPLGPMPA